MMLSDSLQLHERFLDDTLYASSDTGRNRNPMSSHSPVTSLRSLTTGARFEWVCSARSNNTEPLFSCTTLALVNHALPDTATDIETIWQMNQPRHIKWAVGHHTCITSAAEPSPHNYWGEMQCNRSKQTLRIMPRKTLNHTPRHELNAGANATAIHQSSSTHTSTQTLLRERMIRKDKGKDMDNDKE